MAEDHKITPEMATWAHIVRKGSNVQRHQSEKIELPSEDEAIELHEFALIFAEYLYVLPYKVADSMKG